MLKKPYENSRVSGEIRVKDTHSVQPAGRTFLNSESVCSYSVSSLNDGDLIVWGTADPYEMVNFNPFLWERRLS